MSVKLIVFEDSQWRHLRPLTDLTAVPALAFGASNLASRWVESIPKAELLAVEARPLGAEPRPATKTRPQEGEDVLAVNAAVLPGPWLTEIIDSHDPCLFRAAERIAAVRAPDRMIAAGLGRGQHFEAHLAGLGLPEQAVDAPVIEYPWHLIEWNAQAIVSDLSGADGVIRGQVDPQAAVLEPRQVTVESGARVDPFAVLDARSGPIYIGANAVVLAHTVVSGPCVVGAQSELLGGFIGHSTIGPQCRIAGEVADSIWQGYGNKRHHGFVGHSVIGEWVNLGALTTTSDLKNNYGPVRVWVDGIELDSGSNKVGSLIGAHVKTGIGTLLPTGCSIGSGSNLFGGGRFAPKQVPSFGWWDGERAHEYRLDKFLQTARVAMGRRDRTLGPDLEAVMRQFFAATAGERLSPEPTRG